MYVMANAALSNPDFGSHATHAAIKESDLTMDA
jgi:hypothetical protein